MTKPKTLAEKLDATQNGEQFGRVLNNFLTALDKARWEEEAGDGET